MFVALTFERNRLRREGPTEAEIFDVDDEQETAHALVFDVSTLAAIERRPHVLETVQGSLCGPRKARALGSGARLRHPDAQPGST